MPELRGVFAIPIQLNYFDEGGMRFIATGTLTGEELLRANSTVYETREKTLAERDQRAAAINPNIIIAVVGETDLFFAMTRMWQAHTADVPFVTKIFRSMDEAERWVAEGLKSAS